MILLLSLERPTYSINMFNQALKTHIVILLIGELEVYGYTTVHLFIFIFFYLYTKFEVSILNSCKDIFDEKSGERKKNKYREEQIGEGPFSIQRYTLSL